MAVRLAFEHIQTDENKKAITTRKFEDDCFHDLDEMMIGGMNQIVAAEYLERIGFRETVKNIHVGWNAYTSTVYCFNSPGNPLAIKSRMKLLKAYSWLPKQQRLQGDLMTAETQPAHSEMRWTRCSSLDSCPKHAGDRRE